VASRGTAGDSGPGQIIGSDKLVANFNPNSTLRAWPFANITLRELADPCSSLYNCVQERI
jgi:hypothetical protein